jgi:hypothetical protein
MSDIPWEVTKHTLKIKPSSKPLKQCLCCFDKEKRRAIGEEIAKLLVVGFIKEVYHPKWLANPILVLKKNGKWRMCVDYMSLNKACPKDPFPLPHIDQVVNSTLGCKTLCFLDAYSGYHQIIMKEFEQLMTSFITPFGLFCYIMKSFGLKNMGATYQRCMIKCFGKHIIVKSKKANQLVADLEKTFVKLRANDIKLNLEKCIFGVPRGMLLGFIISESGIKTNMDKISAIMRMGPIQNIKGVQ